MKVKLKVGLIALVSSLGVATGALGQDYPNKPVKLFVGYTPGSSPDILGRQKSAAPTSKCVTPWFRTMRFRDPIQMRS